MGRIPAMSRGRRVFDAGAPVAASRAARVWLVVASLTGLVQAGCVKVDGGAFEAVWVLFDDQGRAISDCGCSDPPIASVAFEIVGTGRNGSVAGDKPCEGRSACVFSCQRQTGATPFDIPPGEYAFSLMALDKTGRPLGGSSCGMTATDATASGDVMAARDSAAGDDGAADGAPPDAAGQILCVDSPAQILRQVVRGQATDVNALPLMTHCSATCSGASASGVCAHP